MRWKALELTGWGRVKRARSAAARPERLRELGAILDESRTRGLSFYGAGRSYGDSALNSGGHVCLTGRLDRILAFDEASGIVEVEPGVTFKRLIEVFLPRGWLVPVAPGTGFVTIGGAVAHDIHGKNHEHDGTFGQHVTAFDLLLADNTVRRITRENAPEVFKATCGGCGLTGALVQIAFRLRRVPSAFVEVKERRMRDLDAFLDGFEATAASYSVGWIDALARGADLGRGILQLAEPADTGSFEWKKAKPWSLPFDVAGAAINPVTVKAFNAAYFTRVPTSGRGRVVPYESFLHPLDAIGDWNRLYGRRGFHQFQCVVPYGKASAAFRQLLEMAAASKASSALTVLKRFGPGRAGYLSFPMEGYTLALDLPNRTGTAELYAKLVDVTLNHGGRVYLAKDALLSGESFERMYPELPDFRRVIDQLDPEGIFRSDMARRLGIRPQ